MVGYFTHRSKQKKVHSSWTAGSAPHRKFDDLSIARRLAGLPKQTCEMPYTQSSREEPGRYHEVVQAEFLLRSEKPSSCLKANLAPLSSRMTSSHLAEYTLEIRMLRELSDECQARKG